MTKIPGLTPNELSKSESESEEIENETEIINIIEDYYHSIYYIHFNYASCLHTIMLSLVQ